MNKDKDTIGKFSEETNEMYKNGYHYSSEEEERDILDSIFSSVKIEDKAKPEEKSENVDERIERFKLDSEVIHTFTDGIKEDRKLKKGYAIVLIVIFILQLVVFNAVFILCGYKNLKYDATTLNVYIAGGIIEVVALIKIIVSYLFKDNMTESLKSILEKNKADK